MIILITRSFPFNFILSLCVIFPLSLFLTKGKYALSMLTELPIDMKKHTPFNERLFRFLRRHCFRVRKNTGKWLVINVGFHIFVNALAQGCATYWLFHRSTYHGNAVGEQFGDNFEDFPFTISCGDYLENRTLNGILDYKKLFDGCYVITAGGFGEINYFFLIYVAIFLINLVFGIFWNSRIRDSVKGVDSLLPLINYKLKDLLAQKRNRRLNHEVILIFPKERIPIRPETFKSLDFKRQV